MDCIVTHIPLKCAIARGWTPSEVLSLRGKIGVYDETLKKIRVELNSKVFHLYPDECIRIPEINEHIKDRHITNVCNIDDESMFARLPVIIVYVKNNRMMAEEVKEFWRTL